MNENRLPEAFLENMKVLLGDDYDAFFASFGEGRKNAVRVNLLKMTPQQFEASVPFPVERVPWTLNGYYVDYRDAPGRHPWYRAGLYYLQEPSAMAPAQILPVCPGDKVLDLCAAPGGKATELGARLQGRGVLVANEISNSRVKALVRNIELFGITNAVVTNETPARLAQRFEGYFDKALVDAPCSGEGMFRKDLDAAKAWYPEKVTECAKIQREIILNAADMLRAGGYMVYSTCTFEPLENELVIAHLLRERPQMELVKIPCEGAREAFREAFSLEELVRRGYEIPGFKAAFDEAPDLTGAARIWPHRAGGEGHFIALLHKKGGEGIDSKWSDPLDQAGVGTADTAPAHVALEGAGVDPEINSETAFGRASLKERKKEKKSKKKQGRSDRREEKGKGSSRIDLSLAKSFLEKYASDSDIDISRCDVRDSHVYQMPEDCPDIHGLGFLRAGLHLGELKKNRFEPSQELALALGTVKIGKPDMVVDDGIHISIPAGSDQMAAYLRGEQLRLEEEGERGWRLVLADDYPVGWGKLTGRVLKNKLGSSWRSDL